MNPATFSPEEAFWYGLINYEQQTPAPGDLKLDRMRELLARLGDPHDHPRIVHVAGSKGKGSTAAMLAAVFRSAGLRTGLFTSPHLVDVGERFQVDGRPVARDELRALLRSVRDAAGTPPLSGLTFFEVATAVGFLHFRNEHAGAVVLEVGLGGRFDSTNVCLPAVAAVTSISHDHTALLGDRLASIAAEKAGIIKSGRPVVSGATAPEARAVIEQTARDRSASIRQLDADFRYHYGQGRVTADAVRRPRVGVTTDRRRWPELEVNLLGEHQAANAAVAVAVVEELRGQGWDLPDSAVAAGLAGVEWHARLEVVARRPMVVLDCAHNVASAYALAQTLRSSFPPARRLLVFGCSADKDLTGMFRELAPHFATAFFTRYTTNPRAVPSEQLAGAWHAAGGGLATSCPTPEAAWEAARAAAAPDDLICITGSVFLAGQLRPLLVGREYFATNRHG